MQRARALGYIAGVTLKALEVGELEERLEAIRALAKFDDPRVVSELLSSLDDIDGDVVEEAQKILVHRGEKAACHSDNVGDAEQAQQVQVKVLKEHGVDMAKS